MNVQIKDGFILIGTVINGSAFLDFIWKDRNNSHRSERYTGAYWMVLE